MEMDDAFIEDEEIEVPINNDPEFMKSGFMNLVVILQNYGWFLLFGVIILSYVVSFIGNRYRIWKRRQEDALAHRTDSEKFIKEQERMLAARARLQARYDSVSAQHEEELRKRAEKAREEKLQDWESYKRGGTSKQNRERASALGGGGGLMGNTGGTCRWTPGRRQPRS